MTAGRARWVERVRKEIAMGMRERFPGGRPKKAASTKGVPREISRARAIVMRERSELSFEPETPWQDQSHAERLNTLTGKALDVTRDILELPCDPENLKLLSIQKDAALSILSTQQRLDETRLRDERASEAGIDAILAKVREIQAKGKPKL
jgi:hypothetical protein